MTRDDGLIRTPDGDLIPDPDDETLDPPFRPRPTRKARIAELRRILKDARQRREAQP